MPPLNIFTRTCIALAVSQSVLQTASAANIVVNALGDARVDDSNCTLSEAVVSANNDPATSTSGCVAGESGNDVISFDPALTGETIYLTRQLSVTQPLTINGLGQDNLTLNGGGSNGLLKVSDTTLYLSDITLSNGNNTEGGALEVVNDAHVTVNNSTFSNNVASSGGAIYVDTASLTLKNSTIQGNTATGSGGGGIYGENDSFLLIDNSSLIDNVATNSFSALGDGGAIYVGQRQIATITNTTISGNSANSEGGGVFTRFGANIDMKNSTVSGNSAVNGGGFFVKSSSSINLSFTTVSNNTATRGGGISVDTSATATIENSLISGNLATVSAYGNEIYANGSATLTSSHSLFGDSGQSFYDALNGVTLSASDINATSQSYGSSAHSPTQLSSILSALSDNGGDTLTHALAEGSPAINAADSTNCGAGKDIENDQRQEARDDGQCDIGSVERQSDPAEEESFFTIPINGNKVIVVPL